MGMPALLRAIYPAQCVSCGTLTDADFSLCGPCWRESWFIGGTICESCGAPMQGDRVDGYETCDECLAIPRPWSRGRAAMLYRDNGRRLVLGLKHSDRTELARPAGRWLARAAEPLLDGNTLVVPVPLHWSRLLRRRYNQAALLAQSLGHETGSEVLPDALVRTRRTRPLERGREARFAELDGAIAPHARRGAAMAGRPVLIVDDVMTSGATLGAAAAAALAAGAASVDVAVLARAV